MTFTRMTVTCRPGPSANECRDNRNCLAQVRHDHSLTVVARNRAADFAVVTEPRASASGLGDELRLAPLSTTRGGARLHKHKSRATSAALTLPRVVTRQSLSAS